MSAVATRILVIHSKHTYGDMGETVNSATEITGELENYCKENENITKVPYPLMFGKVAVQTYSA